jgi:hypothetical protein
VNVPSTAPSLGRNFRMLADAEFGARASRREHPDCAGYWELAEDHDKKLHTFADDIAEIRRRFKPWTRPPSLFD